jgi:phospholipase C
MPGQEPGTRPARALPYAVYTHSRIDASEGKFWIDFQNEGKAGAALYARNNLIPYEAPRRYSISAGKSVADYWLLSDVGSDRKPGTDPRTNPDYDVALHGPNGFYSHFRGLIPMADHPILETTVRYDHFTGDVALMHTNSGTAPGTIRVANSYTSNESARTLTIAPNTSVDDHWSLASSSSWFDLSVTTAESPAFLRRFAGHVETGRPSTSDPATFVDDDELHAYAPFREAQLQR